MVPCTVDSNVNAHLMRGSLEEKEEEEDSVIKLGQNVR